MEPLLGQAKAFNRRVPITFKKGLLLGVISFCILDLLFFGGLSALIDRAKQAKTNYRFSKLPGRPKGSRKIAILTYYSNDNYGSEMKKLTWPNKQKYATQHGYEIFDINAVPTLAAKIADEKSKMHNYFYYKYLAMSEIFKGNMDGKKYDYIFWNDPDAIFLNHSKRIEDLVDERFDVLVTTGPPDHPQWGLVVNAGSFVVRNSEFGRAFLEDVLVMSQNHCGEFILENPSAGQPLNGWLQVCGTDGGYWLSDQGILQALFSFTKPTYKCHIKKTWLRACNSEYPWYGDGDLTVHFPGRGLNDKKKLIKAFLKFTNFRNGQVNKKGTEALKNDDSLTADLIQLERLYDKHNPTCGQ